MALTNGAILPSNPMLIFSILAHHYETYPWAREGDMGRAIRFLLEQILTNSRSTDTLAQEGEKVPLREVGQEEDREQVVGKVYPA